MPLLKIGDETLKGARFAVLHGEENVPEKYEDVLTELRDANLKTSRAWAIKDLLRKLWTYNRLGWAKKLWKEWYDWAIRSRLEPVKKVARMLKKDLGPIMNFFKHPISTSTNEGMSLRIQSIKRKAYGYRNEENLRSSVLFESEDWIFTRDPHESQKSLNFYQIHSSPVRFRRIPCPRSVGGLGQSIRWWEQGASWKSDIDTDVHGHVLQNIIIESILRTTICTKENH